ncbi:MAG: PAS domain S-box protein [Candidatus Aminicenantales bacterium]
MIDKVTEGVLLRKNGEKLTAEISSSSIQLWKKWYAIAIVHDITERKLAEEKLKKSESIYRAIFENTGTATIIIEEDTTISLANNEFLKLSGYSREEIEGGKRWTEFVVKEDLERMLKYHYARRKAPDKAPKNYEFRFINKNGSVKDIFITVDMIPGTKKSVASYLDITELKRAEEKIKASLKEKEVMLREIHHRVKNNMQIISSLFRLQSNKIKNKKIQDFFVVCQNRIRSMALIHESLYRAKNLAKIDFSDYINKLTIHLLAMYRTGRENISLRTEVKDIFLDINRAIPCGLIINELVSNSLKHAFPKGIKGEIVVKMHSDKKDRHRLVVSDTGVGFPEKIDFRQAETLGLQMVNDLVNQLNGKISLYRGKGTTFKITF